MKKMLLGLILICGFGINHVFSQESVDPPSGGGGTDKFDERLCTVRPGEHRGTECKVPHQNGLCTTERNCP